MSCSPVPGYGPAGATSVVAQSLLAARFVLLPSFGAPHYDIVLKAYAEDEARRLLDVLGEAHQNPYYVRRQR
jgi:hypothetical protein